MLSLSRGTLVKRTSLRVVANNNAGTSGNIVPISRRGMRLSLFTPYKNLPAPGQIIHPKEAACDPAKSNCKVKTYVYEERCVECNGTGQADCEKRWHKSRGHKLMTCLKCTGLGYVRCTTTLFPYHVTDSAESTMLRDVKPDEALPAKG